MFNISKTSKLALSLILSSTLMIAPTFANDAADSSVQNEMEATPELVSETFGHLVGKYLKSVGYDFDIALVVKGMQDSMEGKAPPMEEQLCMQAITADQEKRFKELSEANLKLAEEFLAENASKPGIVSLEENKLQYRVDQEGTGAVVENHFVPKIRYKGSFIDGNVFGESKDSDVISLDETIPGFSKGIVGMKEGEKRTLYIHPDFAYGTSGYLPPNSLLTFEIEVLDANIPMKDVDESVFVEDDQDDADVEIAAEDSSDADGA